MPTTINVSNAMIMPLCNLITHANAMLVTTKTPSMLLIALNVTALVELAGILQLLALNAGPMPL